MSVNSEFDDILKGKFDSSADSFPFSEDRWARMEEIIIADENKKRKRKFLLIFMSGFMLAVLILTPFLWYYLSNKPLVAEKKASNKNTVETKKLINKKITPVQLSDEDQKESMQEDLMPINTDGQENEIQKERFRTTKGDPENKVALPLIESNVVIDQSGRRKVDESNKSLIRSSTPLKTDGLVLTDSISVESPKEEIASNPVNPEQKDTISTMVKDSTIQEIIAKEETQELTKEELDALASKRDQSPAKGFHFGLNAGGAFNLGYQKQGALADGKSFTPIGGFYLTFSSAKSWSLTSGINYTFIDGLSFQKEVRLRSFDFGYRDQVYQLTQQRLHYLVVPLEIAKIWSGKNKIGLGLQFNYLLATKSELNKYTQTSLSTSSSENEKSYAYTEGLNHFDFQPTISYERMLKGHFILRAESSIGLIDVRKGSWTNSSDKELNKSVRIILKYQIK